MKVRLNTKKKRIRVNKRILDRSVDECPDEIEERKEPGHWEIDTVIGKKSYDEVLLTIIERKTRKEIIIKMPLRKVRLLVHPFLYCAIPMDPYSHRFSRPLRLTMALRLQNLSLL